MKAADFEERLARLIYETMKEEDVEDIAEYATHQLDKMLEYQTPERYGKEMKLAEPTAVWGECMLCGRGITEEEAVSLEQKQYDGYPESVICPECAECPNRGTLIQIGQLIAREHVTVKTALKERIRQLGPLAVNCTRDYKEILDGLTELMEEMQY